MRSRHLVVGGLLLAGVSLSPHLRAQDPADETHINTMRPVIRGRTQAAASMKPEATRAAERILEAGGNAFDAAVAGQAVLGMVDAASNGVGQRRGDPGLRREGEDRSSRSTPKAPRRSWRRSSGTRRTTAARCPQSDTLLSGTVPGVIDAWYMLLDRWGTMTFAQVLQQAIDMAENGFPIGERHGAGDRRRRKRSRNIRPA